MTAIILAIVAVCAGLMLMSRWRQSWTETGGLVLVAIGAIVVMVEAHGLSRPAWTEWRSVEDPVVLGVHFDEPRAIHVWLLADGVPRAYMLPWSDRAAANAFEEMERAKQRRGKVRMRWGDDDRETEQQFYQAPQPALPPKVVR